MMVVDSIAGIPPILRAEVVPGGRFDVFASVFVPFDVGLFAEDATAFLGAGLVDRHERTDVQADAVVQVGPPADGLFC